MAALTALRPEVLTYLPGVPVALADDAILKAVIEFCNRSRAYRFTPAQIAVVASTANYTISDLPTGTAIAWLLKAEMDGIEESLSLSDGASLPLSYATETGTPDFAIVYSSTQIGLRKVPDASGTLDVSLALRPSLTATIYPDDLHNLYQDRIAAGALAKLYATPKKPWSEPNLVLDCRNRFEEGIRMAEYRADRGSSNAPARSTLCLIGGR